uniref:Uncharacterized protein n=1 Tax=Codium arabicum TaxID=221038 RepID=A0A386B0N1_CODAR|nr:hypothetical protein Ycf47 [Codium arabicum]AYC65249.1 hypothetical protein Ycf47 [Codium arabicum]
MQFEFLFHQRILIAFLIFFILIPQTPKENKLILTFNESGLFSNYLDASQTVQFLTILTIILFFLNFFI